MMEDSNYCVIAQSDQNLHWTYFGQPRMQSFLMQATKTLIRLHECECYFVSSLGAHVRGTFSHVPTYILSSMLLGRAMRKRTFRHMRTAQSDQGFRCP